MRSVGYGIPWPIDGPPPQPPPYSLLTASAVKDDLDAEQVERWMNGVEVYPYPVDTGHVHDACASGTNRDKAEGEAPPIPAFAAMTVYLAETCTASGIFGRALTNDAAQSRFVARATAALQAVESAAMEREFMSGEKLGLNPYLADGNGTFPNASTAVSPLQALAILENEIAADTARRGFVHCSPACATLMDARGILYRDPDGRLRTINGTVVVPGDGYTGTVNGSPVSKPVGKTAPSGQKEWIYATGPVEIRRSDVVLTPGDLREALDREMNTVTYRVERYALVDWDTVLQAAVLVDRSL